MADPDLLIELRRQTEANTLLRHEVAKLKAMLTERETGQQARAEAEKLRAENANLQKAADAAVRFKVGEKGGVSVYGLQRFPVTLYREQWTRLLAAGDRIRAFIVENEAAITKAMERRESEPPRRALRRVR